MTWSMFFSVNKTKYNLFQPGSASLPKPQVIVIQILPLNHGSPSLGSLCCLICVVRSIKHQLDKKGMQNISKSFEVIWSDCFYKLSILSMFRRFRNYHSAHNICSLSLAMMNGSRCVRVFQEHVFENTCVQRNTAFEGTVRTQLLR